MKQQTVNKFLFKTVYNLVHPAVLGTILVNIINYALSGKLFQSGAFPALASILLIWYFIMDFWVGLISFEEEEHTYHPLLIICDIIILVSFFAAFYGLWIVDNDLLFYFSCIGIGTGLVLWDYLIDREGFTLKDKLTVMLFSLIILCALESILFVYISTSQSYSISKYIFLAIIAVFISAYTYYVLNDC